MLRRDTTTPLATALRRDYCWRKREVFNNTLLATILGNNPINNFV
jgi:hypothetical protein